MQQSVMDDKKRNSGEKVDAKGLPNQTFWKSLGWRDLSNSSKGFQAILQWGKLYLLLTICIFFGNSLWDVLDENCFRFAFWDFQKFSLFSFLGFFSKSCCYVYDVRKRIALFSCFFFRVLEKNCVVYSPVNFSWIRLWRNS